MKKQNFPIRQKLQFRFFIIMLIYTLSGVIVMPLLEYIFSRFENQVFSWLYLRLDVIYFFYLVTGLACIFYHYWRKPWDYLDEVVMYLAHDIRTPLTAVIGYLSLLDEAPDMPQDQKAKYVGIALDKAERLETLLNELFEITRYHTSVVQLQGARVDLYALLAQVMDEFYPSLSARGNTVLFSAGDELIVTGDPEKLARVFNNLLKNAAVYSYPNTEISISAERKGTNVVIVFKNHGQTIPPDQLSGIFEKFSRLDGARLSDTGGVGLGLSIAKEIVGLHGGEIIAQSSNETVSFTITLPVSS